MKRKLGELQALYKKHFPKVDPVLVEELVSNTDSSGDSKDRLYSLNVMTKDGIDPGRLRGYFLSMMGQVQTSLDGGRHYIVNVYLTLDMVKELQSLDAVEYIRGDYTFGTHAMHSAHLSTKGSTSTAAYVKHRAIIAVAAAVARALLCPEPQLPHFPLPSLRLHRCHRRLQRAEGPPAARP